MRREMGGTISTEITPEEILAGCQVELRKDGTVRTDSFREDETSVDVSVKLHESVEKCYLTIYAYAGNVAFDPDDSHNIRLWSGPVTDGYEGTALLRKEICS